MPRKNASRQNGPQPLHAGDLFTDRFDESTAFKTALAAHRLYMNSEEDVPAAKNVLVYYGVGGIGKTCLSDRLELWVNDSLPLATGWGPAPQTAVAATGRIDLHKSQGRVDIVDAVIAIRRAFGKVKSRWVAFDLAFAAYWASVNPGEPLPGAGDGAFADGVADTITDLLSEIGVPGAGIATRTLRSVMREFRARMIRRGVFGDYEGFEGLLQRCTELPAPDSPHLELLGEIVALLDTDLCNWDEWDDQEEFAPLVVMFVDTFERLTADPRRTDEATINQLIWRLPNVLFVVTGRNMLDWWDERRTNLHVAGRAVWPGLLPGATEDPRQHLVGNLEFDDRIRIIERGRELYNVPISNEVVHELGIACGGLPQYLDLALALARTRMLNGGKSISVADVTGSLSDLVLRVLEDVPNDEQHALRAASLFPYFSAELVEAAAGVDHGCALRALSRPMIDRRGSGAFPQSMHDAIRAAIRSSPHDISNGWSAQDWEKAGELGLHYLDRLCASTKESGKIKLHFEVLGLAVRLVCDQKLSIGPATSSSYDDWLSQAIVFAPSITGLKPYLPAEAVSDYGKTVIDFVTAKSTDVTVDEAVDLLRPIFTSTHPLRFPAGRHWGYTLRNAARYEEALDVFQQIAEVAPTPMHHYQFANTLAAARRFREAMEKLPGLTTERKLRLKRACDVSHGRFDDYFGPVLAKVDRLRTSGRQREEIEDAANAYRWQAFVHGGVDRQVLDGLAQDAEEAAHLTGIRDVFLARVFMDPDSVSIDSDAFVYFERIDRIRNSGEVGFRTVMARMALALRAGDQRSVAEVAELMESRVLRRGRLWTACECAADSYGHPVSIMPTQWLEPYDVVRDRWRSHWDRWLMRVS